MAKNETIFFTQEGRVFEATAQLTQTTLFTTGSNGAKFFSVGSRSDTTGEDLFFYVEYPEDPGVKVLFLQVGGSTANENFLGRADFLPKDKNSNPYINLPSGVIVSVLAGAGTANPTIYGYYENY